MSRAPCELTRIHPPPGDEGFEYTVLPSTCARPGCDRSAVHGHHAVPRYFSQSWWTSDWALIDHYMVPVVIPLCWQHHEECTTNKARVAWEEGWYWETLEGKHVSAEIEKRNLTLIEHPKVWPAFGDAGGGPTVELPSAAGTEQGGLPPPVSPSPASPSAELEPGTLCPTCGKRLPHEKKASSPRSQPLSFRLPDGTREDFKKNLIFLTERLGATKKPFCYGYVVDLLVSWALQQATPQELAELREQLRVNAGWS